MDIETLSREWIKAQEGETDSSGNNHWSIDYVIDLTLDGKSEELWSFIKHTYKQKLPNSVVEVLAAGPMEDLLANFGDKYIEEIEALAKTDKEFKELLGGVWQNSMSDELWERVCKIRGKTW